MRALDAFVLRDQMQVVVAEYDRAIREPFHEAQHLERLGPAVDQIADEPQPIAQKRRMRPSSSSCNSS